MKKLIYYFFLILILCGCNNSKRKQDESSDREKPNIIFYLSDDQDMLDYGCYGNEKVNTLTVDKLASEGMIFTNAFTPQSICAPSRSTLYTGRYPLNHGCYANHTPSKPTIKSVTHYLSELGYEVILAGKSHVGPDAVFNWDAEMPTIESDSGPRKYLPLEQIKNYFINGKKPFCMFITSEYPHGPYYNEPPLDEEDYVTYPALAYNKRDSARINRVNSGKRYAGYYRNIEEDQKQLSYILDMVDKYLSQNTLFMYSADHGITGKFTVYDRGLHTPFVARWPEVIKPGSKSDVMINYVDVLPTLIDVIGGNVPDDIDGRSFADVFVGNENEIHQYVYGVSTNQNIRHASVFPSRSIRSKDFKYIINFNSEEVVHNNLTDNEIINAFIKRGAEKFENVPYEELFYIATDPFETENIASNPDFEKTKTKLREALFDWMKQQGDFLYEEGNMPLLKPTLHPLDKQSEWNNIPDDLENTLKEDYYYDTHY